MAVMFVALVPVISSPKFYSLCCSSTTFNFQTTETIFTGTQILDSFFKDVDFFLVISSSKQNSPVSVIFVDHA
jgi:hypothetical protein